MKLRKSLVMAVFAGLILTSVYAFAAYEVDWMYVQHRSYQDGRSFNYLAFSLRDTTTGEVVTDYSFVREVTLIAPDGGRVNLYGVSWGLAEVQWYGSYYGSVGRWSYDDQPRRESWYGAKFDEELQQGSYTLRILMEGNQDEITYAYTYNALWQNMPVFDVSSFRFQSDESDNLWWFWDVPRELYLTNEGWETSVRALVDAYTGETYLGGLVIGVPTHMGHAFIPGWLITDMLQYADRLDFRVQLRTNDNNNRTYSSSFTLRCEGRSLGSCWAANGICCSMRQFSVAEQNVLMAYIAYYGRPADVAGLQYWSERLEQEGGNLSAIIDAFGNSDEYTRLYGNLSAAEAVTALYRQIFGRDPDQAGLEYYVGLLESGEKSLASIALDILHGAQGEDLTVLQNRMRLAGCYVTETERLGNEAPSLSENELVSLLSNISAEPQSIDDACQLMNQYLYAH